MNPFDCRAYDKINKRIVEVISYDFINDDLQVLEVDKQTTMNNIYFLGPKEYILLPFTGKLDIDNQKIYLGDIVERTSKVEYEDYVDECVDIGEVIYHDGVCKFEIFCITENVSAYAYFKDFEEVDFDKGEYEYNVTYKRIKSKYD